MEIIVITLIVLGVSGFALYYYADLKKKEYIQDYQINVLEQEMEQKKAKAELDAHVRAEQANKPFYMDVILTHGDAIGVKAAIDNEGRPRKGILPIGDILIIAPLPTLFPTKLPLAHFINPGEKAVLKYGSKFGL